MAHCNTRTTLHARIETAEGVYIGEVSYLWAPEDDNGGQSFHVMIGNPSRYMDKLLISSELIRSITEFERVEYTIFPDKSVVVRPVHDDAATTDLAEV